MNAESVVALIVVLPLIAALICRLDAVQPRKAFRPANMGHVLMMWVCGLVLLSATENAIEPWEWAALGAGWLWVAGTWFLQPLMAEAN